MNPLIPLLTTHILVKLGKYLIMILCLLYCLLIVMKIVAFVHGWTVSIDTFLPTVRMNGEASLLFQALNLISAISDAEMQSDLCITY